MFLRTRVFEGAKRDKKDVLSEKGTQVFFKTLSARSRDLTKLRKVGRLELIDYSRGFYRKR